ncbi:MAG: ATP-binding protein [Candidatus Thiodiazotropha sp.]
MGAVHLGMNSKLNLELAREHYKIVPKSSLGFYAVLVITSIFYWDLLPGYILISWVGINALTTSFFLYVSQLSKTRLNESNAGNWLKAYTCLVFIQDVPWSLIGPISFLIEDEAFRMLTLLMLSGVTAGGIISRAITYRNYVISLLTLLSPLSVTLAFEQTPVSEVMLIMIAIYVLFMLSVAKNYNTTIKRNIVLWLDNESLVGELRRSHAEIGASNQDLKREIEQRKQVEQELVLAKDRSERANEAKNQFLATVSHELRTPLNGIMGLSDLLQSEPMDDSFRYPLEQIGKAARTLQRSVNDILDLTAIEAGHIHLSEEPFSLRTELEEVVALLWSSAEQKNLLLDATIDDAVEDNLSGDAYRLRQILTNLISNALKYTDSGSVRLHVKRLQGTTSQVSLRFEVMDTGIGIDTSALESIFDNFTRLENFETRRNEGVGLGLAIVKTLVSRMQGSLQVESQPGEGSCFRIDLDFQIHAATDDSVGVFAESTQPADQWESLRVLVVDDNLINRMILTGYLSKRSIPHEQASNGREALQWLREDAFDLVLLDIQMPDMSGIEVAAQLQREDTPVPLLIAVTAHAFPEQRRAILEAGFTDLLIKPVEAHELSKVMRQAYRQIQGAECMPRKTKNIAGGISVGG